MMRVVPEHERAPAQVSIVIRKGLTAALLRHFLASTGRSFDVIHSVNDIATPTSVDSAVLLIDLALDIAKSHERLLATARRKTSAPAVALCRVRDRRHVEEIMAAGFSGVVEEDDCTGESLLRTLDLISSGETIVPAAFFRREQPSRDTPLERLTDTERRILTLIMEGRMNKEIAALIGRSEIAVKMQVRSLCEKLNARNRTEAAMIGMQLLES